MQKALVSSFLLAILTPLFFSRSALAPLPSQYYDGNALSYHSSAHAKPWRLKAKPTAPKPSVVLGSMTSINLPPAHPGLAASSNSQLKKLAQYEQSAGGSVADRMMVFSELPANSAQAGASAADIAGTLKEFERHGIGALVIFEPTINGQPVNFQNYRNGAYDTLLSTYFQALKNQGVSDKAMGVWAYFPEANMPEWGPVDVADFAPNVTRSVQIQKKYFPASQASIYLDAESYPAGSTDWGNGSYASLTPFIRGIPRGLLDSFGMQGFPWLAPANSRLESSLNPAEFLNPSIASDAAKQLGVSNIWLNSGTMAAAYTRDASQTIRLSTAQRQQILNGIVAQANSLKTSGFNIAVNLFCEDKSNTEEGIDWSYKTPSDKQIFSDFAKRLRSLNIDMWLFDA